MSSKGIEQIKEALKQASFAIENLDSNSHSLIDFDLSLEKVRHLYELLSVSKLESLSSVDVSSTNITFSEPKEDKTEPISDSIDQEAIKLMEEKEAIEFIAEEEKNEKTEKSIETNSSNIKKTDSKISNSIENNSDVNDVLANQLNEQTSLNDILSNIKNDDDLATQLQKRPIQDLKTAISINDKIWFTRELFEGNNEKYLSTLERINNAQSIEEAIAFAETFRWNKKESSTKAFLELIYRRFV